jgi:hypothetical protein
MIRSFGNLARASFFILCMALLIPSLCLAEVGLETGFRQFLGTYIKEIRSGNREFLGTVHPNLPEEMQDFFIGITIDMMKHANENGLDPTITCRDYNICKATWPQPGDSWASQSFILHEGSWRWLEY